MMTRSEGRVRLDISEETWGNLVLALGYAAANQEVSTAVKRLLNELNEEQPDWIPWEVGGE